MAATGGRGRFKELLIKYGRVAVGVHLSVSAASLTGLYIAIKNKVDVESLIEKWNVPGAGTFFKKESSQDSAPAAEEEERRRNKMAELATSSGGALALALLCNKALFPIRVPITIALTPPVARFLARRKLINNPNPPKFKF